MMSDALLVAEIARLQLQGRVAFLDKGLDDTPEAEATEPLNHELIRCQDLLNEQQGPRSGLMKLFDLNARELALLDLCVALQVDPSLEALVAQCQGKPWRPIPTEALVRRLNGLDAGVIFRPTGALARWRLVDAVPEASGAAHSYRADPRIVDWYFGTAALDEGLVERCNIPDQSVLPRFDLSAEKRVVAELIEAGQPVRLSLVGPSGSGRDMTARALCESLGAAPLRVHGEGLSEESFIRLQRFAKLTGRVPVWQSLPTWPAFKSPVRLQIVLESSAPKADASCFDYVIPQPEFSADIRQRFWKELTGADNVPMALQHATPAELQRLSVLATGTDSVELYLRQRALSDLETIGHVKHATLGWDDIVLPEEVATGLKHYASEAQLQTELMGRAEVRRLYANDAAPTALFTGPPGVGKTMAAECIAADLNLPLLVIDVSRTVSKYIGETAKNLSDIVERARRFGCILFFDEADAFFAKRTDMKDSNDRHANADTNHLLQLIERYDGPVVLSTNKPGNIDEAFFRRIRHIIDFHQPDVAQRKQLWVHYTTVLASAAVTSDLESSMCLCAERFELTPAQIKGAVLTAHFDSLRNKTSLALPHLLNGIGRELRKDGRTLPADLMPNNEEGIAHVA